MIKWSELQSSFIGSIWVTKFILKHISRAKKEQQRLFCFLWVCQKWRKGNAIYQPDAVKYGGLSVRMNGKLINNKAHRAGGENSLLDVFQASAEGGHGGVAFIVGPNFPMRFGTMREWNPCEGRFWKSICAQVDYCHKTLPAPSWGSDGERERGGRGPQMV